MANSALSKNVLINCEKDQKLQCKFPIFAFKHVKLKTSFLLCRCFRSGRSTAMDAKQFPTLNSKQNFHQEVEEGINTQVTFCFFELMESCV